MNFPVSVSEQENRSRRDRCAPILPDGMRESIMLHKVMIMGRVNAVVLYWENLDRLAWLSSAPLDKTYAVFKI